jgi:hypothetical protein
MKRIDLLKVEIYWRLEKLSGKLWERFSDGQIDCWFDPIPAFFYRKRKEAERYYCEKYKENIYGYKI